MRFDSETASPRDRYRKILFVLEARHERQRETLASCYARNYGHLIPTGVEIVEFNMEAKALRLVPPGASPSSTGFTAFTAF